MPLTLLAFSLSRARVLHVIILRINFKKSVHFSANRFVGRKGSTAPPTLGSAAGALNKKNSPKNSENSLGM